MTICDVMKYSTLTGSSLVAPSVNSATLLKAVLRYLSPKN